MACDFGLLLLEFLEAGEILDLRFTALNLIAQFFELLLRLDGRVAGCGRSLIALFRGVLKGSVLQLLARLLDRGSRLPHFRRFITMDGFRQACSKVFKLVVGLRKLVAGLGKFLGRIRR